VLPRAALEAQDLRPELHISEKQFTQIHWQLCSNCSRSHLGHNWVLSARSGLWQQMKADAQGLT